MAGIGFVLRKLASRDDYLGVIRGYFHAAFAGVGPWIFLITTLGLITFFTEVISGKVEVRNFSAILIYNLIFSLIFASSVYMVTQRYVADCLFSRDGSLIPGIFIQSQLYLLCAALPCAALFYIFFSRMTPFAKILSIVNFVLLCEILLIMLFLSCIRNFRAITLSWLIGVILAVILGVYLGKIYGATGMLFGLNCGFILILFSLKATILAEYPYRFIKPQNFPYYFSHYKGLFWSGLMLAAGMWIDKIIMWFSKEGVVHPNQLHTCPIYDGAMFYAYTTIIPVVALFIFSLETNFYKSYIHYISSIETNAPLTYLEHHKNLIIRQIKENGRGFLVLQGSLSLIILLTTHLIFSHLGLYYLEFSIFRFGVIGSFFTALNFFIIIYFSYFDSQENLLLLTAIMLISNFVLTLVTLLLGFPFYGIGFALAMTLTFFIGAIRLFRYLNNLTYHIFISNVVKRVSPSKITSATDIGDSEHYIQQNRDVNQMQMQE
jgi:polysaccharide biosynthesis protein PelG